MGKKKNKDRKVRRGFLRKSRSGGRQKGAVTRTQSFGKENFYREGKIVFHSGGWGTRGESEKKKVKNIGRKFQEHSFGGEGDNFHPK